MGLSARFASALLLLGGLLGLPPAMAADEAPALLIEDVYLFDGKSSARDSRRLSVLISEGRIERIAASISPAPEREVTRLDAGGRTLMPGLIDAHWHSTLVSPTSVQAMTADIGYIHLLAGQVAEATLMRGFTSVRDMGGPSFGLRRAIDEGLLVGPRIFPPER